MKELGPAEFSAATGLSAKVLRLYDERGLLVPARVDRATGYRRYTADQVAAAGRIALLRRAGIGLADIERFLAAPTAAVIDLWRAHLAAESGVRRRALDALALALGLDTSLTQEPAVAVIIRPVDSAAELVTAFDAAGPSSFRLSITPTSDVSPTSKPPTPASANCCWWPRRAARSSAPRWASRRQAER